MSGVGEDMVQPKLWYTAREHAAATGNSLSVSSQLKHAPTTWPSDSTPTGLP